MFKGLLGVIYSLAVLYPLYCHANSQSDSEVETSSLVAHQIYPIVNATQGQLFGGVSGSHWISAEQAKSYLSVGEAYRLYRLGEYLGDQQIRSLAPPKETCQNATVKISPLPQKEGDIIALSGEWKALPRVPVLQNVSQPVYRRAVADLVRAQGITDPGINISQIIRIDLDGDKRDEVIISAHQRRGLGTSAKAGDYAVLILRKIIEGEVRTILIEEEYYPLDCTMECAPAIFWVEALLDVNGDGVIEIITGYNFYEGKGNAIYSVTGDQVQKRLVWVCGV